MSLQETSTLPPNSIIDERAKGISIINGCSQRRLSQLTERAVDKALNLKAASRRLVDVVDIQSCGEPEEFGCAIKSAFKLFKSPTKVVTPGPPLQNWALVRKSQDQLLGPRIYSLLMRWRSDPTFEWKARVALAVPILEEALYRVANSKEDEHISQQLLESHLERVLLHFEAGNGLFLLQGTESSYRTSEHENSTCQTTIPCETSGDDASQSGIVTDMHARGRMYSPFKSESCRDGNTTLKSDNGVSRNSTQMQVSGRAVDTLLKKSATANKTRLKCELSFGAPHSEENIANIHTRPQKGSAEMFSTSARGDNESNTHEIKYQQNVINARFSPRKTLGDMINLNWSNGQTSRDPLMMPSSPHLLTICKNDATTIQETLPNRDNHLSLKGLSLSSSPSTGKVLPAFGTFRPLTHTSSALTAAMPTLPSLLMSLSSMDTSSSPAPSYVSLSSLPQISDPSPSSSLLASSSLPLMSDPTPSSHLSVSSSLSLSSSLPLMPEPLVSSSIPSMPDPLVSSTLLPLTPDPLVSSSLPMMPEPSSSSLSLSSSSPPLVSPSVPTAANVLSPLLFSKPLHTFAQCSREIPSSASENCCQTQQPWFSMYGQLQVSGCEIEVQASAAAMTSSEETELEAGRASSLSTSSLSLFSMTESMDEVSRGRRGRGAVRLPLSIFLAERDECKMKDIETWEEPTEQMDPLCCVCMVGLKGAAFIPCGHTFCRKCSRELWRGRGSCPLCNRFIREILDVY